MISERAFNRIDFPDPVSPVTVVKPDRKSISRLSINVKFFMSILVNKTILIYCIKILIYRKLFHLFEKKEINN